MADKSLEIKISADVTSLQAQAAVAKVELSSLNAAVKVLATQFVEASDDMKASLAPELDVVARQANAAKIELAALNAEMREKPPEGIFASLLASMEESSEKVEGLNAKLMAFRGLASGVGELIAAGFAVDYIGEQINKTAELGEAYAQLSAKTGATTQQLAALKLASMETGTDFDTVGNSLRSLGTKMQEAITNPSSEAAKAFMLAGVNIRDAATGQMLPVVDVFAQISAAMSNYADGTAKTALAGDMLGTRFGSALIPVMDKVGDNFSGLQDKAQQLGLVMTQQDIEASEAFRSGLADLEAGLVGVRTEIVGPLLPAFADIEAAMTGSADTAGTLSGVSEGLSFAFKGVIDVAVAVGTAVGDVGEAAYATGATIGAMMVEVVAASEAMEGHFAQALATAKSGVDDFTGAWEHFGQTFVANDQLFTKVEGDLFTNVTVPEAPPPPPKPAAPALGSDSSGGDWMAGEKASLNQQNNNIEQSATSTKQANAEKLQNTVQFWQGVLSAGNLSAAQELQAQDALTKAETALKANQLSTETGDYKSAETTKTQIAADAASARKAIATSEYDAQVSQWGAEVDEKKITKAQEVQDEIAAQNQMYEAALAEAQQEAALLPAGTAAKAKALDDIEVMQAAHVATMAQLNEELVSANVDAANTLAEKQKEAAEATSAAWQRAFQPITNAFDSSLNGVIQGTQTLQQAEMKAAQSITLAFIDAEAKKVEAFAVGELEILAGVVRSELGMTAAAAAGNATRVSLKASGDATGAALDSASTSASIVKSAHDAFGGAYAAVAGIPIVGPELAPAAGATAYAAVLAMDVLSSAGGLQIGAGENPLVQLHENETVLPAYIAKPLSAMLTSGNTMNDNSRGGDTFGDVNFNVTANGGGGKSSSDDILSALNSAVRSGSLQSYPALARALRRGN
jgi:hypothetical protein